MLLPIIAYLLLLAGHFKKLPITSHQVLAARAISLENRQPDAYVNSVFRDNILLTLAHSQQKITTPINWDSITQPYNYKIVLQPNQVFAFHDSVLPSYSDKSIITTNAHFNYDDGFKSDGYLMGDGVCHLASLMNWVARDAGLQVEAPVNHDFAAIPEVPAEYGTSIYYMPGQISASAQQNLYITNNRTTPVTLSFEYDGEALTFSITDAASLSLLGFKI